MRIAGSWVAVVVLVGFLLLHAARGADVEPSAYLVGRGIADITGPPVGLQMLGYVRPDQISQGIHLRQYARAFVVAEPAGGRRLAIVTAELQSVTHSLVLEVLDRVRPRLGDLYRLDNVLIAATHTHSVPGGYWHYAANTPLGSPFHPEHFEALAGGIADSIVAAHQDLRPGKVLIGTGDVIGAGAQRSRVAYLNNPEHERQVYPSDVDTQMILLRFEVAGQAIGSLNWHAVHPTSMSYHNKLISSDNKGYAAYLFERSQNTVRAAGDSRGAKKFVAAFAQSNCGDVTPHLDLKGAGPGKDDFDGTRIIGQRMAQAAERIFTSATQELRGPVDARHAYVDMGRLAVRGEFTRHGPQSTSPPAYGYSFAAGSSEDGGGQPMFREGMTDSDPLIEALARAILPLPAPTEAMRRGHRPKPILLALGAADPPALPQVLPIGVARIGQLAIVIGPAEFTTMSGRRFRQAVKTVMPGVEYVAVAGYAGDYAGYVATREEYEAQHYEGAATLFGPWTQAAYEQQFALLASDLAAGRASDSHESPLDMRGKVCPTPLGTAYDRPPPDAKFGDIAREPAPSCTRGERVTASFWTGNPRNGYRPDRNYARVERLQNAQWSTLAVDGDWELMCRWTQPQREKAGKDKRLAAHQLTVEWTVPADAEPSTCRITHYGTYKAEADGTLHEFQAHSRPFEVR
jgi:neutral ceramidase